MVVYPFLVKIVANVCLFFFFLTYCLFLEVYIKTQPYTCDLCFRIVIPFIILMIYISDNFL